MTFTKYITLCDLFGKEQVVIYANKELDYRVFNKAVPETISADEKTLNFNINQLLENPFNAANKGSSKLPVDADIS